MRPGEVRNLWRPAAMVAGELVDEEDWKAATAFFVVKLNAVRSPGPRQTSISALRCAPSIGM